MAITRSPAYPGISLAQAIDLTAKIHAANRTNPVDRQAAAKDMGFAGMTGSSSKALADLVHYGLIEKAGKGAIRVSQRTVDILYPASAQGKASALNDAAFAPALFASLRAHFDDGVPSEHNLRSYLMRSGFATSAIPYVLNSYRETCRMAQEAGATESHGASDDAPPTPRLSEASEEKPVQTTATSAPIVAPERMAAIVDKIVSLPLNKINMNIQADVVHLNATLNYRGLAMLEKKIASLKALMEPDDSEEDTADDGEAEVAS